MVNNPLIRPAISWEGWHWGGPLRFLRSYLASRSFLWVQHLKKSETPQQRKRKIWNVSKMDLPKHTKDGSILCFKMTLKFQDIAMCHFSSWLNHFCIQGLRGDSVAKKISILKNWSNKFHSSSSKHLFLSKYSTWVSWVDYKYKYSTVIFHLLEVLVEFLMMKK